MTLEQIDDALAAWNTRLAAVAENLLELQGDPTYKSLTGGGAATARLSGATAARVEPALARMRAAFEQFGLLQATIDEAVRIRKTLPSIFGGDQKIAEIQQLLFGRSIELPKVDVALQQRTLLSGSQCAECVTPDELLAEMARVFAAARDAVTEVNQAWADLAAGIDGTAAHLERLKARAVSDSGLADAARGLAMVRDHLQADPLGALVELRSQVQPVLADVGKTVAQADEVSNGILLARAQMAEVTTLHLAAVEAWNDARTKFVDCAALPSPAEGEKLDLLREWLDRLDRKHGEGMTHAVAIGLQHWKLAADEFSLRAKGVFEASESVANLRAELRGRLDALKAKARAYGIAERPETTGLAQQAEALLYKRPTDLHQATAAVAAFERSVSGGLNRP